MGFLEDGLLDICQRLQTQGMETNLHPNMTENASTTYVNVVLVTHRGDSFGVYDVMSATSCADTCSYTECQLGMQETYANYMWYRYKCTASKQHLIRVPLFVKDNGQICEIAVLSE